MMMQEGKPARATNSGKTGKLADLSGKTFNLTAKPVGFIRFRLRWPGPDHGLRREPFRSPIAPISADHGCCRKGRAISK